MLTKATYSMIEGAPVNVLDYGAVGDGITNDLAALRLAVAAACSQKVPLVFPESQTFILTPTVADAAGALLSFTAGIPVIGNNAVLKIANSTPGYVTIIGNMNTAIDLTGLDISGLTFDHNAENTNNFTATGAVLNSARHTVYVKRGSLFRFCNNKIDRASCTNSVVYSGDGNTANCYIQNNIWTRVGKTPNGLYFDHSTIYATGDNIYVTDNIFEGDFWGAGGTTCAIEVHPGYRCVITGNVGTKYHSAINYAGVYETDSVDGIVSGNSFETLRHGVVIFGSTYLTHTTGYSVDGLRVFGNIFRIRNSLPKDEITGGTLGVGGIIFNYSLSLGVRDVYVHDNQCVYDVEASASDYGIVATAFGIPEASANTGYERVHFYNNTAVNPPGVVMCMGGGNGTLTNCLAYPIYIDNPCGINNGSYPFASKNAWRVLPNTISGDIKVGGSVRNADKDKLVRPVVLNATTNSNTADIRIIVDDIVWTDPPADGTDYKLLTTYSDNSTPYFRAVVTSGSVQTLGDFGSFASAQCKVGSVIFRKDTNTARVYATTGTTTTALTPTTTTEVAAVYSIVN
jgi:hypothetical protein